MPATFYIASLPFQDTPPNGGSRACHSASVHVVIPGYEVRAATAADIAACDALCMRVHGYHRHGEVSDSVELLSLMTIGLYNRPAGSYLPSILY